MNKEALARAWDEGAKWAAVECGAIDRVENSWLAPGDNPYRHLGGTMHEYTPITEVVRDACTFHRNRPGEPRTIPVEAFDRWLAEVKARVWDEGYFDAGNGWDENPYRKRMGASRG